MIFVTVGSQKFPFDRLFKAVESCIERGIIHDEVFAQTGYSGYSSRLFDGTPFLSRDEFADKMAASDIVITHAGTGAIVGALKKGKRVVAMPRLARYGEHVDDHQLQIVDTFEEMNLISACREADDLPVALQHAAEGNFAQFESGTERFIQDLDAYLSLCSQKGE